MWKLLFSFLLLYNFYWIAHSGSILFQIVNVKKRAHDLHNKKYISWRDDFKFFAKHNNKDPSKVNEVKYLFVENNDFGLQGLNLFQKNNLGVCLFAPEPIVVMLKETSTSLKPLEYKAVFMHELAHCSYNIYHVEDKNHIMHIESIVPLTSGSQINDIFKEKYDFKKYLSMKVVNLEIYLRPFFLFLKILFLVLLIKYRHELKYYIKDNFKALKEYLIQ